MLSTAAHATTVQVTVTGVRSARGTVRVALCTRAEFLHPTCAWYGQTPARPGAVTVTLPAIPPGTYAAQAYHDENANGRLDRNFLGFPEEPMGFSNDAPLRFGPPRFDAAALAIAGDTRHVTVPLHSY